MGRLVVFEGIDGSGKSTQFQLLRDKLAALRVDFRDIAFPQYVEQSSALIKMYLSGEFGHDPEAVNAYAASSFYAVDRFASFAKNWGDYYRGGGTIITDRYTQSNAIHQGSKLSGAERIEYFDWLYSYEFKLLALPRPDLVLYMDIPVSVSVKRLQTRARQTGTRADIHELDEAYLAKCRECGLEAAEYYGWTVIPCVKDGRIRTKAELHNEISRYWSTLK